MTEDFPEYICAMLIVFLLVSGYSSDGLGVQGDLKEKTCSRFISYKSLLADAFPGVLRGLT